MMNTKYEDIYERVSKNIKRERKRHNLTQQMVADGSEISFDFYRRVEAPNMHTTFSLYTLESIANAIGIDIKYFFFNETEAEEFYSKEMKIESKVD